MIVTDDRSVNKAVEACTTDLVLVLNSEDSWADDSIDWLRSFAWDSDVVFPSLIDGTTGQYHPAPAFDKHLLTIEHYLDRIMVVDRQAWATVGGLNDKGWHDLHWRLRDHRWKSCVDATFIVDGLDKWPAEFPDEYDLQATFYYQATPATTYLRCTLPARYLPAITSNAIQCLETKDDYSFPFHRGKAAVLQYAGDSTWALMQHALQAKGVRTLVEVDDNYLVDPGGLITRNSGWKKQIGQGAHTLEGHRSIVNWADGMIVTTDELAKKYRKIGKTVFVCPNQIDPEDWAIPYKPDDGVFRIGWFASRSHAEDAKLVERAFQWASEQPGVEVFTMGLNPTWWKMRRQQIPWVSDLSLYRREMQRLDVGVCPVVPTPWSVCRSDVKALEYAMGGALPVVSDVPPYAWWHDKPALTAKTAKEFLHHIKWCVQNQDEARALGREARQLVLRERTAQGNAWRWQEAIDG